MSRNPNKFAERLRRYSVPIFSVDDSIQPFTAKAVIVGVPEKAMHEHIHIGKDHRLSIRSSRTADRFRSTPVSICQILASLAGGLHERAWDDAVPFLTTDDR